MLNKEQNISDSSAATGDLAPCATSAERLGMVLRQARQDRGKGKWTIERVASKIGRGRVWLNRVELGYSKDGSVPLPTNEDLGGLARLLKLNQAELICLRDDALRELEESGLRRVRPKRPASSGRRAQAEVFRGDENVYRGARELLERQSSESRLKVTHVVTLNSDPDGLRPYQREYVEALATFLSQNQRSAALERVVHADSAESLELARAKTAALAGGRPPGKVRNIDTRFCSGNPILLDILIGEREAFIAIPDHRGHPALAAGILVSDMSFVEALRTWFHEIVWKAPGLPIDYSTADQMFNLVRNDLDEPSTLE